MSSKTTNIVIGAAALVAAIVIAVIMFSGGDDPKSPDTTAGPGLTTDSTGPEGTDVTETTGLETVVTADPNAVLPNDGAPIAPGSIDSETQELSADCTTSVEALRELMGRYDSGLLVDNEEDMTIIIDGIKSAKDGCPDDEFKQFYDLEFVGWNNGTTGFVPPATDPAAEETTATAPAEAAPSESAPVEPES